MDNPQVIYEDNHILVVEKPPNLLTQGDRTGDADLLTLTKGYVKEKYGKPGDVYLGLVHRMDRPVGGLLCLARTSKAAARLSAQVATHAMGRIYLALVKGQVAEEGRFTDWLLKDEARNTVSVVSQGTPGAKEAILSYRRLAHHGEDALVAVTLETGRSHQIRVQFAHAGHPLIGDIRYGKQGKGKPVNAGLCLWGAVLRLEHPTKKEEIVFVSMPRGTGWAPYEDDIQRYLSQYTPQGDRNEQPE